MLSGEIRAAVEAKDLDRMVAALAPEVVVHSPVAYRPFTGVASARVLFEAILSTYEDFRYVEELHGGSSVCLVFQTRIGSRETQGIHLIHFDEQGLADELTVMVRPLSAAHAFAETVGPKVVARLQQIGALPAG